MQRAEQYVAEQAPSAAPAVTLATDQAPPPPPLPPDQQAEVDFQEASAQYEAAIADLAELQLPIGWLADRVGARRAIFAALAVYTGISVYAFALRTPGQFLTMGVLVGTVQGGAQALVLAPTLVTFWSGRPADLKFWQILLSVTLVPIAAALGALYYVYYWGVQGATPGKRLFGLAVEGTDGTRPIGLSRAGVRFLGYLLSGGLLGIGFLMILFGGQGLHDRMSDTRVVRAVRS